MQMAEGDNKIKTRKVKAVVSDDDSRNGGFEDDHFEDEVREDEGFKQEGGTTHGSRRHRAQTLIILGVIVLGVMGLAASFLLRDEATPAPRAVTPRATLFVTIGPTRIPTALPTPRVAPTFVPISIQRADTPRQTLCEIKLADGQLGTNTSGKNTGLYSYDGRWLATLSPNGTSLSITGADDEPKQFDLPELADANPQLYAWAPDNTTLLLTAGFSSTKTNARQIMMVRWDEASNTLSHTLSRTAIPISTTLDALTLGAADQDSLGDVTRTALAYWSPDGSRLAVVADAVLDDPSYNADGTPRFRKLIRLFDRTGQPLGQFETTSDCCYWTPRNELLWWNARDPNAPEYVFHILSYTKLVTGTTDTAPSAYEVRVPVQYAPGGLWVLGSSPFGNESNGVTKLLIVELGKLRRLAVVDFDNRVTQPILDRLEQISSTFSSPDVPVTALRLTRPGADNTLWFYDWGAFDPTTKVMGMLIAGGQVQQLGSWDAQLRGFTAVTSGQNAGTTQVELLDAASSPSNIDYSTPAQSLRAETSVLRPWPVNTLGYNATEPSLSNAADLQQVSPNGRWRVQLKPTSNALLLGLRNFTQWPSDIWTTQSADMPIAEFTITASDQPALTFTQVITLGNGIPIWYEWSPDSMALAITTLTNTSNIKSIFLVQVPVGLPAASPVSGNESNATDQGFETTKIDPETNLRGINDSPGTPVWSQDGATVVVGSDDFWIFLNQKGVEQKRIPRDINDRAPAYLSGNLFLLRQGSELQKINLRDTNFTRQSVYTWTTSNFQSGVGLAILGVNADASEVMIAEPVSLENLQTTVKRVALDTGTVTPILQFDGQPCCNMFSAGPSNQPILGFSSRNGNRILDQHIWFYDWKTSTLYDYDRPAKLLGWDATSKSFLLARRSIDGFQVEAMQPLIQ